MAMTHADARVELVEQLNLHVRDLVRRQGVDPQRDPLLVRRIAEDVVRDHDERSLTGVVTPVPDAHSVVGELVARVSGFGPLQPFLDDPAVEEVWIDDPSRVFIARNVRHELTNLVLTLLRWLSSSSGCSSPAVAGLLPLDDSLGYPPRSEQQATRLEHNLAARSRSTGPRT